MKLIAELTPSVQKSDVTKNAQVADAVNKLFVQLKAACPAMFNTLNSSDERAVKRQWIIGFVESGINTVLINAGMRIARQQNNPFMPSVGQFIEWCEKGLADQYGLLTAGELVKKLDDYCARRGFDDFCNFDYGSDANYWLITDLYQIMQDQNLSKNKLLCHAEKLISEMAKKFMKGYVVPSPKKSLPKKIISEKLTRSQQLLKLEEIKSRHGLGMISKL